MDEISKQIFNKKNRLVVIGVGTLGIFLILFLAYRYIAPFGALVKYTFTNDKNAQQISGLEDSEAFYQNGGVLLKIPQQIIRKNVVTFNVKPKYKDISNVNVLLRFKGSPKEIKLGIKGDPKGKYTYKTLYNGILNPLPAATESGTFYWQKNPDFKGLSDFAANLPGIKLVGYFNYDPTQLLAAAKSQPQQNVSTTINTVLRGSHVFSVRVTQSPFILKVEKTDLNTYDGEDKLQIKIEKGGQVLADKEIGDDGVTTNGGLQLASQSQEIRLDNAQPGVYKVTLKDLSKGTDVSINKIEVNQKGLVFSSPLYIVDPKPSNLLTDAKSIVLQTPRQEALQNVFLDGRYSLPVNKINTKFSYLLDKPLVASSSADFNKKDVHTLTLPLNNVFLNGDGNFAFNADSFFNLKQSNFLEISKIKSANDVDYIVANYTPVIKKGDFYEVNTTFTSHDFQLNGDNLYFSLESPDLANNGGEITVDSLEVSVTKP